jgi:diaminopimelate decarboxylase
MEMWSSNVAHTSAPLSLSSIPVTELAKEFGTPTFFLDEADFRNRVRTWRDGLQSAFGKNAGQIYYAAKAFICVEVARWLVEEGIGIDVCTGGELAVAMAAHFPPERIELHGNNKSLAELESAISAGVGTIVADSLIEIERIADLCKRLGKRQRILLRITPGIEAHTHESIATAHEDVKFGFSISSGAAWAAIEAAHKHSEIQLQGFHCHIGSQIFSSEGFTLAAQRLIALLAKYKASFNSELPELDLGGGYGISYLAGDEPMSAAVALQNLASAVTNACSENSIAVPRISIEPGRAIVGPTMFTLYEVGTIKDVTTESGLVRKYISIDGGMSDNIRPALYGAEYTAVIANRKSTAALVPSRIVGKHCETGDIVIRDCNFPSDIAVGDLLAIPATGAYGRSMANNYNHVPRPPVVAVRDGKARIIVRRETEVDLLRLDTY